MARSAFGFLAVVLFLSSCNGGATIVVAVPSRRALVICADKLELVENSNPSSGPTPEAKQHKRHLGPRPKDLCAPISATPSMRTHTRWASSDCVGIVGRGRDAL